MDSSMYAIDIIWIWFMLGYNMIIYLAALQEVSTELLEAAKIDGARAWQTVRSILWPLVSPTTFLLLITGLIMTIKQFGIIQAITQGARATAPPCYPCSYTRMPSATTKWVMHPRSPGRCS